MKVQCPDCGWSAEVPDEKVPVGGGKGICPKRKTKFVVLKQEVDKAIEQTDGIPSFLLRPELRQAEVFNKTVASSPSSIENNCTESVTSTSTQYVKSLIKQCPFCAEEIHAAAIKCKHCQSILNKEIYKSSASESDHNKSRSPTENAFSHLPVAVNASVPNGLLITGYIMSLLMPIVGFIIGINILVKGKIGDGLAMILLSSFFGSFFMYIIVHN